MGHEVLVASEDESRAAMSSLDVMKYLDEVQRDRYAAFQETFESAGWPLVIEWAQLKALEAEKMGMAANSPDEWRVQQGVRSTWEQVAALATMFMNEFENVAMQNQVDMELESEDDFSNDDDAE